jgi:hypothetical protein
MNEHKVNKRNGVASLMQLEAKSTMESEHMYSFDKDVKHPLLYTSYKQHTNFDREPVLVKYTNVLTNSKVIHTFDNKMSDMIGNFMVRIQVPKLLANMVWCNDLGHALIKYIRIINIDEEIAYFTGEYLNIIYNLDTKQCQMRGVNEMISHFQSPFSLHGKSTTMYIEIPFLKSNDDTQFFPILNSGQKTLIMHIQFASINELIRNVHVKEQDHVICNLKVNNGNKNNGICLQLSTIQDILPETNMNIGIMYDSIKLSDQERILFLTRKSNILFKQVQYREIDIQTPSNEQKIKLDFRHNIVELIVVLSNDSINNQKFQYKPLSYISILLNGINIQNNILSNKYDNRHSRIPNTNIYVIPFALEPTCYQPTGTYSFDNEDSINFNSQDHFNLFIGKNDRRDSNNKSSISKNNELQIFRKKEYQNEKGVLKVFAISYNVLRVEDKSISLQYI